MSILRTIIASLVCACACAGEAALPAVAEGGITDMVRLRQRLDASPYGKAIATPQAVALRERLDGLMAKDKLDLNALLSGIAAVEYRMILTPDSPSPVGVIASLRPTSPAARARWTDLNPLATADGDWLVFSENLDIPARHVAVVPPAGEADAWMRVDARAIANTAGGPAPAILALTGLTTITGRAWVETDATREQIDLPGARLPITAIDPAALAGLPARPLLLLATGLDGARATAVVRGIAGAVPAFAETLRQADAALSAAGKPRVDDLLASLNGTAWLAVTPGMPFPTATLALPACAATDTIADLVPTRELDLSPARSSTVMVPLPPGTPINVVVRRTATHWLVSTDLLLVENLAAGTPGGFADGPVMQQLAAQRRATGAPVALVWQDMSGLARTIASYLPMAAASAPREARPVFTDIAAALHAMAPQLPGSLLWFDPAGDGLRGDGRNASPMVGTVGLLAGMLAPAVTSAMTTARQTSSRNNMKQLLLNCVLWANDHDMAYPPDLATLTKDLGADSVPAKLFRSPAAPKDLPLPHYLYVRPSATAPAMQPVIIENPACNRGRFSNIAYADGHVDRAPGEAHWQAGLALAALPAAAKDGITMDAWRAAIAQAGGVLNP